MKLYTCEDIVTWIIFTSVITLEQDKIQVPIIKYLLTKF